MNNVSRRNDTNLDAPELNKEYEDAETNAVGVQVHYNDLPEAAKTNGPCEVRRDVINYDEVSWSRRMRVVTACEAIYRDCGYLMHRLSHTIIRLAIHLPGENNVYFQEGEEISALHRCGRKRTQLEAYFDLNKRDENARKLTFLEMAKQYRWDRKTSMWVKRIRQRNIISRMYTVSARFVEKFCLRMLLKYVKGAQSFEDVRTVNGVTHSSFYDACIALGLTVQDTIWEDSLAEVCSYRMPRQVRQCFATMIAFGAIAEAPRLWEKYKPRMLDRNAKKSAEELEWLALRHIQRILNAAGQDIRAYGIAYSDNEYDEENVIDNESISRQEEQHVN